MAIEPQIIEVEASGKPRRFVFVLMRQFTMLCFASAIEALRIANRTAGRELYDWRIIGEGGETASCSNGCVFGLDADLVELERDDTLMLCGGVDVHEATTKRILNWIRREARRGATIAGLCTAGYTMAKAGLLNGKKATIHWENQDSFAEEFEEVELRSHRDCEDVVHKSDSSSAHRKGCRDGIEKCSCVVVIGSCIVEYKSRRSRVTTFIEH